LTKGVKFPAKVVEVLSKPTRQVTGPVAFWLPEIVAVLMPERLPNSMATASAGEPEVYSSWVCSRLTVASGNPVTAPIWKRGELAPLAGRFIDRAGEGGPVAGDGCAIVVGGEVERAGAG
jgi:hypothetical protein